MHYAGTAQSGRHPVQYAVFRSFRRIDESGKNYLETMVTSSATYNLRQLSWWSTLLAGLACFLIYRPFFLNPSGYLMSTGSDGLKNYFTPAYYVRYDSGVWFSGMNYPYGEVVSFTDNQPLISWLLKFLDTFLPIGDSTVGILNFLMVSAPIVSAWLLHRILWAYGVRGWFSVVSAVCVSLMAPQLLRFFGHFGLAYTWVIPLAWYLLLRIQACSGIPWIRLGVFSMYVLAVGWIHPYFAVIAALLAGALGLVSIFIGKKRDWYQGLPILAAGLGLVIFMGILAAIDPYSDRPALPWGAHFYHATAEGFLAPSFEPLHSFFHRYLRTAGGIEYERRSYLGVAFLVVLLAGVLGLARQVWRWIRFRKKPRRPLTRWSQLGIAGLLVFFVASGMAHSVVLDRWQESVSAIAQFRSLARLGWIVFYFCSVYMVYWYYRSYRLLRMRGQLRWAQVVLGVYLALTVFDIASYQRAILPAIQNENTYLNGDENHWLTFFSEKGIDPAAYQAVWINPLLLSGSERLDRDRGLWSMGRAVQVSYSTGLPLINNVMSRTSADMVSRFYELYLPEFIPKQRLADFNEKPILVIGIEEESLLPGERAIIRKTRYLGGFDQVFAYELNPQDLFRPLRGNPCEAWEAQGEAKTPFLYEGFEGMEGPVHFADPGAYMLPDNNEFETIARTKPAEAGLTPAYYEAGVWVYMNPRAMGLPELKLDIYGAKGEFQQSVPLYSGDMPTVYQGWAYISAGFPLDSTATEIALLGKGKGQVLDGYFIGVSGQMPCRVLGENQWLYGQYWLDYRKVENRE
jgi:hypothetical protein